MLFTFDFKQPSLLVHDVEYAYSFVTSYSYSCDNSL